MLVYHPDYHRHAQTPNHVESPKRLDAIIHKLEAEGLLADWLIPLPAEEATVREVHRPEYVDFLKNLGEGYLDTDTYVRR